MILIQDASGEWYICDPRYPHKIKMFLLKRNNSVAKNLYVPPSMEGKRGYFKFEELKE